MVTAGVLAALHLVVSLLELSGLDWTIQWYTSVEIARGTPLYEQGSKVIDGDVVWLPYHFPVFFYAFAAVIYVTGFRQAIGRVFLWLCTLLLAWITSEAAEPDDQEERWLIVVLFLASPHLFGIGYNGLFDQFVSAFMVAGLWLGLKGKHWTFTGGLLLGLGAMSKLYPLVALGVLGAGLLRDKRLTDSLLLVFGFVGSAGTLFAYHYSEYGDTFLDRTVYWQVDRLHISSSLWYYFQEHDLDGRMLFWVQLGVIFAAYLLCVPTLSAEKPLTIYFGTSAVLAVMIATLRVIYPHYFFWIFSAGVPALLIMRRSGEKRWVFAWLLLSVFATIGSVIWTLATVDPDTNLNWQICGAVLTALALFAYVCYYFLYALVSVRSSRKSGSVESGSIPQLD